MLSEALPSLADELAGLLLKAGEKGLASQVPTLRVTARCDCGDGFCATIYTGTSRPVDAVDLEPEEGMIAVDLDRDQHVVGFEILDRPEHKKAVDDLFSVAR
ncbi:MAG: DUF2283 domain-containing protein [Dehalococcoidia bacterium]